MTTRTITTSEKFYYDHSIARFLRMFVSGSIGAAILNFIVWILALGLGRVVLKVLPPGDDTVQQLQPMAVLMASIIPALGAALLYWILDRVTSKPMTWFLTIAVIFLVLSVFPIFSMPVTGGVKFTLLLMHIVSAVGIVWGVRYVLGYLPDLWDGE